jgi:PAS domain S-box-containing protein
MEKEKKPDENYNGNEPKNEELIKEYQKQIEYYKQRIVRLEEINAKQKVILSETDAGAWEWNLKTDSIILDDKYLEMLGYNQNDNPIKCGNDCFNFIHPDDVLKVKNYLNDYVFGAKNLYEAEFRMLNKNGNWIWVISKGKCYKRDFKGEVEIMVGMHINISSIKSLEEKYIAGIELWHAAFADHTSIMLLIEPISGKIVDANNSAAKYYGYSIDTLKQMKISDINMLNPKQVEEERLRALKSERNYFIFPHKLATGEVRTVEVNSSIVYLDNQKLLFSIIHDITERKIAEENLKISEEKFAKVFKLNPVACAISDIKTQHYIEVNNAFCSLLEFSPEEVIGESALSLGIIDDKIRQDIISNYDENRHLYNYETTLFTKYGKEKHVVLTIESISVCDRYLRISFINDITELKKSNLRILKINEELVKSKNVIEEVLREKEIIISELNKAKNELEKTNNEKDKLFSIISHDLKSPFQGLLGLSEVLATNSDEIPPDELKELYLQFNITTNRVYNLLLNLLEWSKIKRGIITFEPALRDISVTIAQNIKLFVNNKKQISILNNVREKTILYFDEKMINSVIRNLLTNAIKFSKNNSSVLIDIIKGTEGFDTILVKDNGIGIPEEILKKLFIVGEKIGRLGTMGEESTGLGLLLCKEFIEKHKGKIWVESKENVGSTFYFSLPNRIITN